MPDSELPSDFKEELKQKLKERPDENRVERRKSSDRRVPDSDRRSADRVVSELTPRRQKPDRRRHEAG